MANYKLVNADQLDADMKTVADKIREKSQLSDSLVWPDGFIDGVDQCSSLNFDVVAYDTEEALLAATPKENTIGIITTTKIPSWSMGDYPNPSWEMSEGHVYININASSYGSASLDFNALKTNEICIAPISAKQYVSNAWKDVDMNIYQDGAWGETESGLVIYDSGTFGKNSSGTTFSASCIDDGDDVTSITKASSYMKWDCGEEAWGLFYITPKISCDGYKTLKLSLTNASVTVDSEGCRWGLASSINAETPKFNSYKQFSSFSGSKTLDVDISSVGTGSYYIALRVSCDTGDSFSARVTKIWLE